MWYCDFDVLFASWPVENLRIKEADPEDVQNACMARACTCMCSAASVAQSLDKGGTLVRCNEKAIQFSSSADIKIFDICEF